MKLNEAKIAAVVERWRKSGFGITLHDSEHTPEEQVEILRRCEAIAAEGAEDRQRVHENRIHRIQT